MSPIVLSEEVADAISEGRPVVALESTIIAHGLPWPRNLSVALELEEMLRRTGATPATVGVIDGVPRVGLADTHLEIMAHADGVTKASVRDLPAAMAGHGHAGTTVAATAFLAAKVGVRVFATGGLGGVHRGAAASFDESADLATLARTRLTVVCAGVKSILDVSATLERLETLGITVVGYGTDRFPGFYVTDSGHTVDQRVDDAKTVAGLMSAADSLGLDGAIILANPVPPEEQLDPDIHEAVLVEALAAAERAGLQGKPVTPFLLDYIQRRTEGASLTANVAAVRNNVHVAGEVARAWSALAAEPNA